MQAAPPALTILLVYTGLRMRLHSAPFCRTGWVGMRSTAFSTAVLYCTVAWLHCRSSQDGASAHQPHSLGLWHRLPQWPCITAFVSCYGLSHRGQHMRHQACYAPYHKLNALHKACAACRSRAFMATLSQGALIFRVNTTAKRCLCVPLYVCVHPAPCHIW